MGPSKKRKLTAPGGPAAKRNKGPLSKAAAGATGRRAVDAASLSWKSAGEEFLGGIEVIEGVDVVKSSDGGVEFVVVRDETGESPEAAKPAEAEGRHASDESFEGFGDGDVEGGHVDSDDSQPGMEGERAEEEDGGGQGVKKKDNANNKKKKKKKMDSKQGSRDNGLAKADQRLHKPASQQQGNSFGALMDDDDDDGGKKEEQDTNVAAWMGLNLSAPMLSAIATLGFSKPTRIQEEAIPPILRGRDVIGKAQTGSGKTLAFGIPVVEKWLEMDGEGEKAPRKRTGPMALVLSPTRELAKQLADHLRALCEGLPSTTSPYICTVTGGLSIQKQQRQLAKADVVIGTPGRLWEVLDGDMALQRSLSKIRFLVVDEADRLFKAGQFKEAEDIIGVLDSQEDGDDEEDQEETKGQRQTLVFSATFDKDLQSKLAGKKAKSRTADGDKMEYLVQSLRFRGEPEFIDANPVRHMASNLREGLMECGAMEKDLYLYTYLMLHPGKRTLVFTNSISAVRRLTPLLANLGLSAVGLHSQMMQKARLRSVERFSCSVKSNSIGSSNNNILVATDVAARGLDIPNIDQVLHYHVPRSADTYIHRSGRTARADKPGLSVLLCSPDEVLPTRRLAAKVHASHDSKGPGSRRSLETMTLDGHVASRLRVRVQLAKTLADAVLAKEKASGEDSWLRDAADELGCDLRELEENPGAGGRMGGRGGGRRRKEKEARALTKAEMAGMRARLREELGKRVNLGVSERYITGGRVDMAALLRDGGGFLG